ncbi:MAG: 2-C-methyl-D-erythritol 2,4-cyclodiphosphate synthase [Fusobacteria bacterium]|nr:2-C-methyl-D-erythritol 2,4-cyclodiphosphate synthase [Fusobacteriota bacterium]
MMRVGIGYDVHRLTLGRKLILGGVEVPFELGLLGHSDADVLVHSIMDALLGSLSLGDIGQHFPDDDSAYKGIDSLLLLKKVKEIIDERGYQIANIDSIIIAQEPKLKSYIKMMEDNIAGVLELEVDQVSVKATTEEKLGFTGNIQGIKAQAVVLVERKENNEII